MPETYQELVDHVVAVSITLFVVALWIALNLKWAIADIVVELTNGGAFDPWFALGIIFVGFLTLDAIVTMNAIIQFKIHDRL